MVSVVISTQTAGTYFNCTFDHVCSVLLCSWYRFGHQVYTRKISTETGIDFEYGQGNLREGLWVTDIDIKATDDLQVLVDKAYVKIGWRAVFAKEVHLRDADIQTIEIINNEPPTGEPFDYKTLQLPVNLRFDRANIKTLPINKSHKTLLLFTISLLVI